MVCKARSDQSKARPAKGRAALWSYRSVLGDGDDALARAGERPLDSLRDDLK